jgi:hypothetical protein
MGQRSRVQFEEGPKGITYGSAEDIVQVGGDVRVWATRDSGEIW